MLPLGSGYEGAPSDAVRSHVDEMPFMIPVRNRGTKDISPWERLPHGFLLLPVIGEKEEYK